MEGLLGQTPVKLWPLETYFSYLLQKLRHPLGEILLHWTLNLVWAEQGVMTNEGLGSQPEAGGTEQPFHGQPCLGQPG